MSKPQNALKTRIIKVSGNRILEYYLQRAVETGLYGNNSTAAAGVLLSRAIEDLVERGIIERAPKEILEKARNRQKAS